MEKQLFLKVCLIDAPVYSFQIQTVKCEWIHQFRKHFSCSQAETCSLTSSNVFVSSIGLKKPLESDSVFIWAMRHCRENRFEIAVAKERALSETKRSLHHYIILYRKPHRFFSFFLPFLFQHIKLTTTVMEIITLDFHLWFKLKHLKLNYGFITYFKISKMRCKVCSPCLNSNYDYIN